MANANMMKRIKYNKSRFNFWAIVALVVSLITGFVVFYVRRNNPTKQHPYVYSIALIVAIVCLFLLWKAIAVKRDNDGKLVTEGDLKGRHAIFIDLLGISLFAMILSTFWKYALLVYLAVPIYIICFFGKKILNWLHYS